MIGQKERRPTAERLVIGSVQSGLEADATDEYSTGLACGTTASGGSCGLNESALGSEVGIVGLLGAAVHRHDLALRGGHAGHGARVGRFTVGAAPTACIKVVRKPVAGR